MLPVLAELGTPAALEAAQAATKDSDPEVAKEAVRVLALWPNAAPAAGLLDLARASTVPAIQVLALRGCIEVAAQEPDAAKRLAMLQAGPVRRHAPRRKEAGPRARSARFRRPKRSRW